MLIRVTFLLVILGGILCDSVPRPSYAQCTVPQGYESQLNIIPIPRGSVVRHGSTVTIMCRTPGETYMNHIYTIDGVSTTDIFFSSYIQVTCWNGSLQPNLFLQTKWCAKGCVKFPAAYDTQYGYTTQSRRKNPLLNYGKLQAPVSANPLYPVKADCATGYTRVAGDNGNERIRCTETGYNKAPYKCSAGCAIPIDLEVGKLLTAPNADGSGDPPYTWGALVTVICEILQTKFTIKYSLECKTTGWKFPAAFPADSTGCKNRALVNGGGATTSVTSKIGEAAADGKNKSSASRLVSGYLVVMLVVWYMAVEYIKNS